MGALAGILNHHNLTAGQALTGKSASPMAGTGGTNAGGTSTSGTGSSAGASGTGSSSSSSSSTESATISASDFLTLLVTELQNQDPTANTDPNEYVNQLVSVNSLEQLIGINQTLTTDLGSPTASSGSSTSTGQGGAASPSVAARGASGAAAPTSGLATSGSPQAKAAGLHPAPGNLGIPAANPSAQRVAQSLSGHS